MRGAPIGRTPPPEVIVRQSAPVETHGTLAEEPGGSSGSGFGLLTLALVGAVGVGAGWYWFVGREQGLSIKLGGKKPEAKAEPAAEAAPAPAAATETPRGVGEAATLAAMHRAAGGGR